MSDRAKRLLMFVGMALFGGLILYVLLQTVVAAFIGGIAGGIVGALIAFVVMKGEEAARKGVEMIDILHEAMTVRPEDEERTIVSGLLRLNVQVREAGLDAEVVSKTETVIDCLRRLVPDMQERYPGEELTWEIKRVAHVHLRELFFKYMALPEEMRVQERQRILLLLDAIVVDLGDAAELVKNAKVTDFGLKAAVIKRKFGVADASKK